MAKIDLDSLSIDELATLRDHVAAKLLEKVTARQVELEAEMERLAQLGARPVNKKAAAPVTKPRKARGEDAASGDDFSDAVSEAA